MGRNVNRIEYIDLGKGFAILCVVCGHVLCYDLYGFKDAWSSSSLMKFICMFHVPLFIFLSGLVSVTEIKWTEIPLDIWKRFRSLIIPFFIVGSIYSFWHVGNLSFVYNNYKFGYWYLPVLFSLYLINYPLVMIGGGKYRVLCRLGLSLILWWGCNHYLDRVPQHVSDMFSLDLLVTYFPYFIMGNIMKQQKIHKPNSVIRDLFHSIF